MLTHGVGAQPAPEPAGVALLVYEERRSDACFSEAFLALSAAELEGAVEPRLTPLSILSPALREAPIGVLTGEGFFEMDEEQRLALRAWLDGGGFLIASAGCSNLDWALSFRHEIEAMYPGGHAGLAPLPFDHAVFDTLYHIDRPKRTAPVRAADADLPEPPPTIIDAAPLEGLTLGSRLAVVFSPDGLNDTAFFAGACCCCGTGEVLHSRKMLANLVAFALQRRAANRPELMSPAPVPVDPPIAPDASPTEDHAPRPRDTIEP